MIKSDRGPRPAASMSKDAMYITRTKTEHGFDMSPCLYRMFSSDGSLLYIGQSMAVLQRLHNHRLLPWFAEISRIEIQHLNTREEAFIAEKLAIYDEEPRHNILYNGEIDYTERNAKAKRTIAEKAAHREQMLRDMNAEFARMQLQQQKKKEERIEAQRRRMIKRAEKNGGLK